MYEQAFGLSAAPFQVNPDPSFYFESKGHSAAFQYLRFGAFQGEGFVVVTGEIGAGKTTLLRALLAELDPAKVVAAQLVSTQLGADDLLSAVAQAFGIDSEGLSKARLLVTLEAYLARLATSQRRALLIIDEAQNLDPAAIEELRMLSNFQFGHQALLQSFLVGQPELRRILQLPHMEQLRQRVIASYHLGPMSAEETAAYVRHRLRHVGWNGARPAFDDEAFVAIHGASGGVPRRINTLCNRLLLSAFLDSEERIDARRVGRVHAELRAELAGAAQDDGMAPRAAGTGAPLLCIASSTWGLLASGALQRALAQREDLPPMALLRFVGVGALLDDRRAEQDLRDLGVPEPGESVELRAQTAAGRMAEAIAALSARIDAQTPAALLVPGDGPIDAVCAMVASQVAVPVVRMDAGLRSGACVDPSEMVRAAVDQVASLLFVGERIALARLGALGVPESAMSLVGAMAADVARIGSAVSEPAQRILQREGLPASLLTDPAGFVLIWIEGERGGSGRKAVLGLDRELRSSGWRVSLLCPTYEGGPDGDAGTAAEWRVAGLKPLSIRKNAELFGLMRHARCLLTDCGWLQDLATALGLPCLTVAAQTERQASLLSGTNRLVSFDVAQIAREVAELISAGGRHGGVPELWDGFAGERIAARLSDWLLSRQDDSYRQYLSRS